MACGLPCIGTRVGGLPEVLGFGRYGRLVEPDDAEDLSRAIMELARNSAARKMLGQAARAQILNRYSMDHMLEAYSRLYREPKGVRHLPPPDAKGMAGQGPRVLMLSPLPPLVGGMATVTCNLLTSRLAEACQLTALNNGKTTRSGRSLLTGILSQLKLAARLIGTTWRQRIQIVHIHTVDGFSFWRDSLHQRVAALLGKHVVWHIHGATFNVFAAKATRLQSRVLRWALEGASAVIVLSPRWLNSLRPYAPRANWRIVANGVPLPPSANDVAKADTSFLFLGDWTRRKGVHDLVEATATAIRNGFQGTLCLAGFEKEPGQREALDRHIAESGCGAHIRVLGSLEAPEREAALRNACCLVLPSYGEGLPMAILEAMGHGVPIIATRVGAIPEVIEDGKEGFLIEPGDVQALADRLVRLAVDADLRSQMGTNARRRAQEEYSLDAMVERIIAIYLEILAGDRAGSPETPGCGQNTATDGDAPVRDR